MLSTPAPGQVAELANIRTTPCTVLMAALLSMLAGCAAPPAALPTASASAAAAASPGATLAAQTVYTVWRVVQARTEPLLDKRRARLDFRPDGRLLGHTSCNTMNGSFTLKGDQLTVGKIATTRMACAPLQLEQEDRILTALEVAATARVRSDGLLELRDNEGRGVLRAVRADLPE